MVCVYREGVCGTCGVVLDVGVVVIIVEGHVGDGGTGSGSDKPIQLEVRRDMTLAQLQHMVQLQHGDSVGIEGFILSSPNDEDKEFKNFQKEDGEGEESNKGRSVMSPSASRREL